MWAAGLVNILAIYKLELLISMQESSRLMKLRSGKTVPKPVSKPAPKVRMTKKTLASATAVAQRRESLESPRSPLETRQPAQRVAGQVSFTWLHVLVLA